MHYSINRNPRTRLDKNCEFELKPTKSAFDLNIIKTKLVEFLIDRKEIEDIDSYLKFPNDLFIEKMDIYYGIPENKNIESGVYTFAYLAANKQNFYYFSLYEDWIEIFDIESSENLSIGINKILDFAENQIYCHLKTRQIIKYLIEIKYTNSCLDNPIFDLP